MRQPIASPSPVFGATQYQAGAVERRHQQVDTENTTNPTCMSVRMTGAVVVGRTDAVFLLHTDAVFLLHTAKLAGFFFILLSKQVNHIFDIIIKSVDISL